MAGTADLRYLWQWGFSNTHCQNYEKKIKIVFFQQEGDRNMHPVFLFMSPEGSLSNFPIRKRKKAETSAKGLLDHTDCSESSDTLGEG